MKTFIKHNAIQIKPGIWLKKLRDGGIIKVTKIQSVKFTGREVEK